MSPEQELWLKGLSLGLDMRFRPLGSSMVPFLRDGDIVTIEPGTGARAGQVVLTGAGEGLLLHRVVGRRRGRVVTKGDALGRLDAPVAVGQILGVAVAREREGRVTRLDTFGARFWGLAFSLTVPLIPGAWRALIALKRCWVKMAAIPRLTA